MQDRGRNSRSWFDGRVAALGTMHQKESVITPLFAEELAVDVQVPRDFDTDPFGTFTREIKRAGDQLQAARAKARAAATHAGVDLALASEGSFGTHPSNPFVSSNLELVVLIDMKHELEIVGHYRSSSVSAKGQLVYSTDELLHVAHTWSFPEQGVILRRAKDSTRNLYKELTSLEALQSTSTALFKKWSVRSLFIETDMRAHRCPLRMANIGEATRALIRNCKRLCPACATPGFVVTDVERGLPCEHCARPTEHVAVTIATCTFCKHESREPVEASSASPANCQFCNP